MEYLALIAEIEALKEELAVTKGELEAATKARVKAKVERVPCPYITAKGVQCKKYCVVGCGTCKVHGRPKKEKPPPKEKPKKVVCTGLNMRGNPCKNKCIPGQNYCERHDPSLPPKEKKGKIKKKGGVPEHNHGIDEIPTIPCKLCSTHGDMFDPGVTESIWVDEATFWARRNDARMI
jgi:hypothetical protein